MKIEWNKRYTTIAIYAFLVIFFVTAFVFFLLDFDSFWNTASKFLSVFNPIFCGIGITYLLSPFLRFFENRVFSGLDRKGKYRLKRTLSVICTLIFVVLALVLFFWRILPMVFRGYADLQTMSGLYLEMLQTWLLGLSYGDGAWAGYMEKIVEYAVEMLSKIYGTFSSVIPDVSVVAGAAFGVLKTIFLGAILSIYFMLSKERLLAQIKKTMRALLDDNGYLSFARGANLTDKKFGGYVKGQLADALIMGTICFLCTFIIGVPYYPLVSTLFGIFCVIPVLGPVIGMLIGALIILLADPLEMLWFMIFMIVLIQVNKHMIRPLVIRSGVDASSVFMFTSIVIMMGILGFWGLIIGVPIFTILYAVLRDWVEKRLLKKGLATDVYAYFSTDAGRELHLENERKNKKRRHIGELSGGDAPELFTEELPCVPCKKESSSEPAEKDEEPSESSVHH